MNLNYEGRSWNWVERLFKIISIPRPIVALILTAMLYATYYFFSTKVECFEWSGTFSLLALCILVTYQLVLIQYLTDTTKKLFCRIKPTLEGKTYVLDVFNQLETRLTRSKLYYIIISLVVLPFIIIDPIKIYMGLTSCEDIFFYCSEHSIWSLMLDIYFYAVGCFALFLLATVLWIILNISRTLFELGEICFVDGDYRNYIKLDIFNIDNLGGLGYIRDATLKVCFYYFVAVSLTIISYLNLEESETLGMFQYEITFLMVLLFVGLIFFIVGLNTIKKILKCKIENNLHEINERYQEQYQKAIDMATRDDGKNNEDQLERAAKAMELLNNERERILSIDRSTYNHKTVISFMSSLLLPLVTLHEKLTQFGLLSPLVEMARRFTDASVTTSVLAALCNSDTCIILKTHFCLMLKLIPILILVVGTSAGAGVPLVSEGGDDQLDKSLSDYTDPATTKLTICGRGPSGLQTTSSEEEEMREKIESGDLIADTAMEIASEYPGEYNINQVCEIYNTLRNGWFYLNDPSGAERFSYANETLKRGKIKDSIGVGDCDDFAILMASLIQSIGGTTRVNQAYGEEGGHAYAEVYLSEEGDEEELLNWIKNEYSVPELPGVARTGGEVWLNLDWNATYPGGAYFNGKKRVSFVVDPENKNSPKIIPPIIDSMEVTEGWVTIKDDIGSSIEIGTALGKKGNSLEIRYDLLSGGWVGISKDLDSDLIDLLSGIEGLDFYTYGDAGVSNTIEFRMVYDDGTAVGISWDRATVTDGWEVRKAFYENIRCLEPEDRCKLRGDELDLESISKIQFVISNNPEKGDRSGSGTLYIDQVQGRMAIPRGSPWARAEEERQEKIALDLATESDTVRDRHLTTSVLLAVESMRRCPCFEGNRALRRGLNLMPRTIAIMHHDGPVNQVAFSPDGATLATASYDGTARIWNASTGNEIVRLKHDDSVLYVEFSPDGAALTTTCGDGTSRSWDASTGTEIAKPEHYEAANPAAFSPDGATSATIDGRAACLWDASTGRQIAWLQHYDTVNQVVFSPDGATLATASRDGTARLWDASTGKEMARLEHDDFVLDVKFSPDGTTLATASYDGTARLWDVSTGTEIERLKHDDFVLDVKFSPDSAKIATASSGGTIRLWNASIGTEIASLEHDDSVYQVVFSPDGATLATASNDGTIRLWDASVGTEIERLDFEAYQVEPSVFCPPVVERKHVAFSPDGTKIATSSEYRTVRLWDASTGKEMARLEHDDGVYQVVFSPDGTKIATASNDGTAWIWKASTGEEIARLEHYYWVYQVVFSPDSTKIATSSSFGEGTRLWDAATGTEIGRLEQDWSVWDVAFSPDGTKIATASDDGRARLWDTSTGVKIPMLELDHDDFVYDVEFSPDGDELATASHDGTARLWDTSTGKEIARLEHDSSVWKVAFSPDGTKFATASNDGERHSTISGGAGTARLWLYQPDDLIREACSRLPRNLTQEEWARYLPDEPYRETCDLSDLT